MPRLPEANKAIKKQRRHSLVTASLSIFGTTPYEEVSVDTIAKKARLTRSLFYHYFKDKGEVFSALLNEVILPSGLLPNYEEIDGKEGLLNLCEYYASAGKKNAKSLWIARICLQYPQEEGFVRAFPKFSKAYDIDPLLTRLIKVGQKEGYLIAGPKEEIKEAAKVLFAHVLDEPESISADMLFNLLTKKP